MDSLTQIILGAAVGEATLGKKVGNRAMVWGGIAGTIPDLDVLSNLFMEPIDSLAFHRAISHSFVFSLICALLMGWLVRKIYSSSYHKTIGIIAWSLLLGGIGIAIIFVGSMSLFKIFFGLTWIVGFLYLIYKRYNRKTYMQAEASLKQWQWMFFLSLVTHPILDCFTTYGTQFLLPFSDQRIAFNNIAVADPAYTLPFMICLIIALFLPKSSPKRRFWNNAGLVISSIYMLFTIFNKTRINTIFENSLHHDHIEFSRYMTTPTILNNVLWGGIAETDSAFYYGQYSFFDKDKLFKLNRINKTDASFENDLKTDTTLKTLSWFSNGYYVIERQTNDSLIYYDLRFGTFKLSENEGEKFVFKFNVLEKPKGTFTLLNQGEGPRDADFGAVFQVLWKRISGI